MILGNAQGIGKSLIVHDLPLAQIFDGIDHVGIVAQAEDVVVGHPRLCSAARSSFRSAIMSPFTPTYFMSKGTPLAATGYTPVV